MERENYAREFAVFQSRYNLNFNIDKQYDVLKKLGEINVQVFNANPDNMEHRR